MNPIILFSTPAELAEQDCACPDGGFQASAPALQSSALVQTTPQLYRAPLPDEHQLVFDPFGFSNVVVLNSSAQTLLAAFAQPRHVDDALTTLDCDEIPTHAALDTFIRLGLLRSPDAPSPLIRTDPKTLTAWLHVTNACNLRCTYCYLHKTNAAMDEATGTAAIDAVFRSAARHEFENVKFKYAGGEATLNFNLVQFLHARARERAEETGLEVREVVLSNGVGLTRAMIEFLRDEKIRLMISLDGIGAAHDAQRVFANGHGSFTSVVHAIDRAMANGLSPHLSITVTAQNADALPAAVHFALDRHLPFNLNFYRDNDCVSTRAALAADHARLIAGMQAAFAAIEAQMPRRRLIDGLVDRSSFAEPHEHACGAGHNYMVVDEQGRVARCQMEIEKTITNVMADDPLLEIRAARDEFQNFPVSEKSGCVGCTWKYWCAGGCSLLTLKATGRTDIQSPYCEVYRALYPDVLRLEGLRLLKYHAVNA